MASKRNLRRKGCTGKKRFSTLGEALERRRRFPFGRELMAYGCHFCGGFHLGHPNRPARRAMAARREG